MSYTPTYTFSTGVLDADQLTNNQQGARDYLNGNILQGDLSTATFTTADMQPGWPVLINDDYRFITGGISIVRDVSDDATSRRYVSGTVKQQDITQQVVYVDVAGAGRRLFLEDTSEVVIELMGRAIGLYDGNRAYYNRISPNPSKVDSRFYIAIDGVVKPKSICHIFAEGPGATASNQSALFNSGNEGYSEMVRRPLYMFWAETGLTAGWHTIQLVCDPRYPSCYIDALSMQIEVFSRGGRTTWGGSSFLTTG